LGIREVDEYNQCPFLNSLRSNDFAHYYFTSCGELGIRTPGPVTVNSFQDCRIRPLCQLSGAKISGKGKRKKIVFANLRRKKIRNDESL
jgi:hypothetical protein